MSDKEIALKLMEIRKIASNEDYIDIYFKTLEEIRNYKESSIIGKLEKLFYEYDRKSSYSEFDKNIFIDEVRKILLDKGE